VEPQAVAAPDEDAELVASAAPAAPPKPATVTAPAPQPAAAPKREARASAADAGTAKVVITGKPTAGRPGADIRVIQVSPGSSLYDLMTNIYGTYDPRYVPRIQAMNPQMKDPNFIVAGDELRFPEDLGEETRKQSR
jgi:hypothetical protein